MLKEYCGFKKIYIACGYTDLRNGIDGLASIIQNHFSLDPFEEGTLFLFCGRKTNRMKGLLWEGGRKIPMAQKDRRHREH